MKLYISRDRYGWLTLHEEHPFNNSDMWFSDNGTTHPYIRISRDCFPEVTFENSPQEVELKLCHQTETIKIADCNPKAQPCVLTNHGIDTNVVKFD